MRVLFSLFVFILICSHSFSQKQLVLIKQNKIIVRIDEGEFLRFKLKGEDHFRKGIVEGIHQDFFRMGEDTTYLCNVAAIDLRGRPNSGFKIAQSGVKLIFAGVVLMLADAVNSGDVGSGVLTVSGVFIGSGIMMQFVNNDIFKMGRKKRIITMG